MRPHGPVLFDYEQIVERAGHEMYALRRDGVRLDEDCFCIITEQEHHWLRITQWRTMKGRRYWRFGKGRQPHWGRDRAMKSGIAWAKRRSKEDRKRARYSAVVTT